MFCDTVAERKARADMAESGFLKNCKIFRVAVADALDLEIQRLKNFKKGCRSANKKLNANSCGYGGMADALDLGSSPNRVQVQVLLSAPRLKWQKRLPFFCRVPANFRICGREENASGKEIDCERFRKA